MKLIRQNQRKLTSHAQNKCLVRMTQYKLKFRKEKNEIRLRKQYKGSDRAFDGVLPGFKTFWGFALVAISPQIVYQRGEMANKAQHAKEN